MPCRTWIAPSLATSALMPGGSRWQRQPGTIKASMTVIASHPGRQLLSVNIRGRSKLPAKRWQKGATDQASAKGQELPIGVTLSGAGHLKAQSLQVLGGFLRLHHLRIKLPRLIRAPYPRYDVMGKVEG